MKKLFTILIACFVCVYVSQAQTPRLVLVEEATNASCGPCANANPALQALLNANEDICTSIKYQWYFPGYDPMHNHNPQQANARVSYYGINGVPHVVVDGTWDAHPNNLNQSVLNQAVNIESQYFLQSAYQISANQDSIYVQLLIEKTGDNDAVFNAQIVVIEKAIHFASPPGSNGEKDFYHVMKRMLPSQLGTPIPAMEVGDYYIVEQAWKLANIYDMDELGVVCFLQTQSTKDVHQAANGEEGSLDPLYDFDVAVTEIGNLDEYNCSGTASPKVLVNNYSETALTTLDINYTVNGEETQTYSWTGNLGVWESVWVDLPEVAFGVLEENTINVDISNMNGTTDDYANNNFREASFLQAYTVPGEILLVMRTDDNPEELTWEITDMEGNIIVSGGPYSDPGTIIQETYAIPEFECYNVTVYDAGGDGLQMPGFIAFTDPTMSDYIIEATTFGSQVASQFFSDDEQTVAVSSNEPQMSCFPNPANDNLVIDLDLQKVSKVNISIVNSLGQKVIEVIQNQEVYMGKKFSVDISSLKSGVYFVRMDSDGKSLTERLMVVE